MKTTNKNAFLKIGLPIIIVVLVLLVGALVLNFTVFRDFPSYDRYNVAKEQFTGDEIASLIYDGVTYTRVKNKDVYYPERYDLEKKEMTRPDVVLSWSGNATGLGTKTVYYSDTAENPLFIYSPRFNDLYLREDYNYMADTFVVEGTEIEISLSEIMTADSASHTTEIPCDDRTYIILVSKTNLNICCRLTAFMENGKAYTCIDFGYEAWALSDSLVERLTKAGFDL